MSVFSITVFEEEDFTGIIKFEEMDSDGDIKRRNIKETIPLSVFIEKLASK